MPKCETCGKEFDSAHGLKIHNARAHAAKAAPAPKPAPKAKVAKKAATGAFTCETCGREFKMAAHLARHAAMSHGKPGKAKKAKKGSKGNKVAKAVAAPAAVAVAPAAKIDVRALTIDQLLSLKAQIDARLTDIVKAMRAAKVAL